jgi:S-disulfanyl-L-cysteine oxidoreductase SoxD
MMRRRSIWLVMVLACLGLAWSRETGLILTAAQRPNRTVWDGVFTDEQATRGKAQYAQACASCHAADLRGDGNSPSLIEESFAFQWNDTTVGELFTRIRTLMPSNRPNSLSPQTYRDIVAFILQANGFPAGANELDGDADALAGMVITTKRPESKQ